MLCLQAWSGFKILNWFRFVDDNVFNKEMLSYDDQEPHGQVCHFQLGALCVMQVYLFITWSQPDLSSLEWTLELITIRYNVKTWITVKAPGDVAKMKCPVPWPLWMLFHLQSFVLHKYLVDTVQWWHSIWLRTILNEYNTVSQIWTKRQFIDLTCLKPTMW